MLSYMRHLPQRDLGQRRRFVVFATAASFTGIVIIWLVLVFLGRKFRAEAPTATPPVEETAAATELPRSGLPEEVGSGTAVPSPSEASLEPSPSPVVSPAVLPATLPVSSDVPPSVSPSPAASSVSSPDALPTL
jgi:hypothetical protein